MSEEEKSFSRFSGLLDSGDYVAITIKQSLAPANDGDPVIFPPSYPMAGFRGRVHTVRDGDYRVSVELPPDPKRDKGDKNADQKPGYNLDRFPDGTSVCEIDSPQSQANRIEPRVFKDLYPGLVPQIVIKVGNNGTAVNLLDAGHRAADAVVRMSSLADKFHAAFLDVKAGDHFALGTLAPTSLLFGVWDSRSTNVKVQRILKAHIYASNVLERTRSAQFTPATDYVATGAVDDGLDSGEGNMNPLSSEGMKHALATQTVGGVMLTGASELTRTVTLNLAALRGLRGSDAPRTQALQSYVLGLALLAATSDPDLNLREGCNLRLKDAVDTTMLVPRRGAPKPIALDPGEVQRFAQSSAEAFFALAQIAFAEKGYLDAIFERDVAEAFLGMGDDRDKVRKLGPITAATLKRFQELKSDPFKLVGDQLKAAKSALGNAPRKRQAPVRNLEALKPLADAFTQMSENASLPAEVTALAVELAALAGEHDDSHETLKAIDKKIKEIKKLQKKAREEQSGEAPAL